MASHHLVCEVDIVILFRDIIREDFERFYTEEPIYITYIYGFYAGPEFPILSFWSYWNAES